jgi:hypothetical protein
MDRVGVKTLPDGTRREEFRSPDDVQPLIDMLRAKGIPAWRDASGACSADEKGHFHATTITIRGITAKDARKLLR